MMDTIQCYSEHDTNAFVLVLHIVFIQYPIEYVGGQVLTHLYLGNYIYTTIR